MRVCIYIHVSELARVCVCVHVSKYVCGGCQSVGGCQNVGMCQNVGVGVKVYVRVWVSKCMSECACLNVCVLLGEELNSQPHGCIHQPLSQPGVNVQVSDEPHQPDDQEGGPQHHLLTEVLGAERD